MRLLIYNNSCPVFRELLTIILLWQPWRKEKADERASKYSVIFHSILIKVVASKEEAEVAMVVEKALRNAPKGLSPTAEVVVGEPQANARSQPLNVFPVANFPLREIMCKEVKLTRFSSPCY